MTVDRRDVDLMAKFAAAVSAPEALSGPATVASGRAAMVGGTGVAEMKSILERFYLATDQIITETAFDTPLRESFMTEPTPNGVRIGNWEIMVHTSGKRKYYDVVRAGTHERLAVDLTLYEAAQGLVRHLNDGGRINSAKVLQLLDAEQRYSGAVNDMILFRHRLTKSPNGPRAAIHEARYGAAHRTALSAKTQVCKLAESL